MKRVLVGLKSIQRDASGKDTVVELLSPGEYHEKNNVKYIIYNESEVTGLDGVRTTIKIKPDSVILIRNGNVSMRHEYVLGDMKQTVVDTPFGELHMGIRTHELNTHIEDGVGNVHLGYDISVGGEWQFYNQLDIKLQEDTDYGDERQAQAGN